MRKRGLTERGRRRHAVRAPARLPAAERREAIVEAALRVFSAGSYAGATTAGIAREAGVSEPILYRHFASKRDLYVACLEEAWARLRSVLDAEGVELDAGRGLEQFGRFAEETAPLRVLMANLWLQAITEAGEDAEIGRFVLEHMRGVHDYHAALLRRGQRAGSIAADRDADAEAWIFLAGTLLLSLADRLGGLLGETELEAIRAERVRWLAATD
ncbi:MAG TPA: helix-turn-helix domain-containing protein [Gaiellaceae bacterium]|nr:helix-turn-helix domain-containing protein [Gaiellaceae bacterium]